MTKFAAFLRGINVGGNKLIKMDDLKKCFASVGFKNVKTILASGNVLFESTTADEDALAKKIADKLKTELGHDVGIQIRSIDEIQKLPTATPSRKSKSHPKRGFTSRSFPRSRRAN
jgi:uncharacterized protein (DUF1697 family)